MAPEPSGRETTTEQRFEAVVASRRVQTGPSRSGALRSIVTSWSALESYVASRKLTPVRGAAADFRCPVLGTPEPIC
jgi:hypothetical protein